MASFFMSSPSGSRVDSQASDSDAEAALVVRVAAREQEAFAELYGLYRRRLARFLGRFLASSQSIDEVINDVMFVVWQDASRFELRSKVSTWIFGIAWHKALKALERQKRDGPPLPAPAEIARPDDGASALEIREWLGLALDRLSPDQRLVVELTFFAGCSYQEIATIAGCPVNTVKTRMFHARHRLRDILVSLDTVTREKIP
jgi:RNA polymerase sigma-70 factor (ECF subfamily)